MDRTELITQAILDKNGSEAVFYSSSDILLAAGITADEESKMLEQLKATINSKLK